MKKLVFIFLLLQVYDTATSQEYAKLNTYRDAVYLAELVKETRKQPSKFLDADQKLEEVLQRYNRQQLENWQENTFLRDIILEWMELKVGPKPSAVGEEYMSQNNGPMLTSADAIKPDLSSIASLNWQSRVLYGTANFMSSRLKDEITNYGLHLALKKIEEDEHIRVLFARSWDYIAALNKTGTFYHSDLNMLKYNAEYDLQSLPDKTFDYLKQKVDPKYASLFEEVKFYYTFINDFREMANPVDAINRLTDKESKHEIILVQLLNNAFRNLEGSHKIWVSHAELQKDNLTEIFFMGLLLEQIIQHDKSSTATNTNEGIHVMVPTYAGLFESLEHVTLQIRDKNTPTIQEQKNYFRAIYDLYKPTIYKKIEQLDIANKYVRIVEAIPAASDLRHIIEQRQYQYLLPQFLQIAQFIDPDLFVENRESFQLVTFLLALNTVESSEEVKDLLETTALPIGSATIKRVSHWNIAFNGYVGITAGSEWLMKNVKGSHFNYGLTAPIGISFSGRISKVRPRSLTVFLSVFDIGALVNQNLKEEVATDSKIRFEQFIAPGVGLFYNAGKSPFTFGVHTTHNPSMREVNINGEHQHHIGAYRANVSFLVDIPLFNLYVNNRK